MSIRNFFPWKKKKMMAKIKGYRCFCLTLIVFEITPDISELFKIFPVFPQLKGSHTMFPAL